MIKKIFLSIVAVLISSSIVHADPAWLNNSVGLTPVVSSGWTDLSVNGQTVSCVGRTYTFSNSPFPSSIVSQGNELLNRAIVANATNSSTAFTWAAKTPTITLAGDHSYATITDTLDGTAGAVTVSIGVTTTVYFDGLIYFTLSMDDTNKAKVTSLSIDIPMIPAIGIYRKRFYSGAQDTLGFVPAGTGVVESGQWVPTYWIGDDFRGLFMFWEHADRNYPNWGSTTCYNLSRSSSEILYNFLIKKSGQSFCSNWSFSWGIQATPTKTPGNSRSIRLSSDASPETTGANVKIVWPNHDSYSNLYYGYPQAANPTNYAAGIAANTAAGKISVPYICDTFCSEGAPEWSTYSTDWQASYVDSGSSDVLAYGASFASVLPSSSTWRDFISYTTNTFMGAYNISGLYMDNYSMYRKPSSDDSGTTYYYQIMDYRNLHKRMYNMVKGHSTNNIIIAHMSGHMTIPFLSYADYYLDGEQFRYSPQVVADDYMSVMTLDQFRQEFCGNKWGPIPIFLPAFSGANITATSPTRGMMALLMIHDIGVWPTWCNVSVVNTALSALDSFGYSATTFVPYFDPIPPTASAPSGCYVSAYKKSNNHTLLIVSNLTKSSSTGNVVLNPQRFLVGTSSAVNHLTSDSMTINNGSISVTVGAQDYAMIDITGGTPVPVAYYVSNTGSDSANGLTVDTPWQTISKVNGSSFSPGDSVLFKRGDTWRETLIVPSSGVSGNPITFGAYGSGNAPIINGAELLSGTWTNAGSNHWTYPITWSCSNQMMFDGDRGTLKGSTGALASPGDWYCSYPTITIYSTANPLTVWSTIENSRRDYCVSISKDYITVDGIHATQSGVDNIIFPEASNTTTGVIIKNCLTDYASSSGIVAGSHDHASTNFLIDHNIVDHSGSLPSTSLYHGIYLENASSGIVSNNTVSNSMGFAVQFQDLASNNVMDYNISTNNAGLVVIWNNGLGMPTGNIIQHNSDYGAITYAILQGGSATATTNSIVSNTITNLGASAHGLWLSDNSGLGNFKDNVIYSTTGVDLIHSGGSGTMASDYNIIGPERSNYIEWQGIQYSTLLAYSGVWGLDVHSLHVDPSTITTPYGTFVTVIHDKPGLTDINGIPYNSMYPYSGAYDPLPNAVKATLIGLLN